MTQIYFEGTINLEDVERALDEDPEGCDKDVLVELVQDEIGFTGVVVEDAHL